MRNTTKYFSIHNIVNLAVIDNAGWLSCMLDNLNVHYENLKTKENPITCDLIIEIRNFKPKLDDAYFVEDEKYYFKEDARAE